jgi:hypothetical protein
MIENDRPRFEVVKIFENPVNYSVLSRSIPPAMICRVIPVTIRLITPSLIYLKEIDEYHVIP